jgi:hypothetical protein
MMHCKRSSGAERAWSRSREDAQRFAQDPANQAYHGDIAYVCLEYGYWHSSKIEWLAPSWDDLSRENAVVD